MAVLTGAELAKARRLTRQMVGSLDYDKSTINAALQAIEDWFETNRAGISTDIDTATNPTVLTNTEKKRLGAAWLLYKSATEKL